jgi:hypothetical protein
MLETNVGAQGKGGEAHEVRDAKKKEDKLEWKGQFGKWPKKKTRAPKRMVATPNAGVEPATLRLKVSRSIQLS